VFRRPKAAASCVYVHDALLADRLDLLANPHTVQYNPTSFGVTVWIYGRNVIINYEVYDASF
jgi:hypothetical protein